MTIYWKLNDEKTECKPVKLIKETDCFVTYSEKNYFGKEQEWREKKEGNIFPTFEEAKQFMISYHKTNVSAGELFSKESEALLKKVNDLVKPEVEL